MRAYAGLFILASCGRVGFVVEETDASASQDSQPSAQAIVQRGASAATMSSQGFNVDCQLTIAKPAGVVDGDLLIGIISTDAGYGGGVLPPGWASLALSTANNAAIYKIAANEPDVYLLTIDAGPGFEDTCESAGVIAAFSGVNAIAPVAAETVLDGQLAVATIVAPSLDAPQPGMLVGLFGSNGPKTGMTPASGMTSNPVAVSPGDWATAQLAWEWVSTGPTGDRTATIAPSRDAAGALVLLVP